MHSRLIDRIADSVGVGGLTNQTYTTTLSLFKTEKVSLMKNYSTSTLFSWALKITAFISIVFLSGLIINVNAAGVRLDPTFNTGTLLSRGFIRSMAVQPDGKIIIGGFYTLANGSVRNSLVRVNADGSLDNTFNTGSGPNSFVEVITLRADGKILIGGSFTFFNGVGRNRIARLNSDGSVDTSFDPGTGATGNIHAIAQAPDNDLYVGGLFTGFNGFARGRIVRLNENGSVDPDFNPGTGASAPVYDVKLQPDGAVVICGSFSTVNGLARRRVARLLPNGSVDGLFVSGISSNSQTAYALALQIDGRIIVGGYLRDPGFNSKGMVRLLQDGSVDSTFDSGIWPSVAGVRVLRLQPDGKILAGGVFNNMSGRRNVARFIADGSVDQSFSPGAGANAGVLALALQADGKILIGGDFYHFNGNTNDVVSVVRLNADGSGDSSLSFSTRTPGVVYDLAVLPNGKTVIAGDFIEINGERQHNVARLNADGSRDNTFDPLYGTDAYWVYSLVVQTDGKLVIGGLFTDVNYASHNNIARLNANGTVDSSFNAGTDEDVNDMKLQPDGKLVIGGVFTEVNGASCIGIARLSSDGNLDMSFQQTSDIAAALLYDLTIQPDGKIIIGGLVFSSSLAQWNIARLNANGTLDASFNVGTGANNFVLSTAVQPDGKVLIGGQFTSVNGVSRNRIARLKPDGSVDDSFTGTGANSTVWTIEPLADGKIFIGGYFNNINGVPRTGIARLNPDGSLDNSVNISISGGVEVIRTQVDGKVLLGGYRITPSTPIVRLVLGSAPFDFDGDGKTDVSVFRPSGGYWYISQSSNNAFRADQFGANGDLIAPGDYDGDGKTDTAVFRPSNGYWYFLDSSTGGFRFTQFGQAGDIPATGDFEGDGKSDVCVFRPSTGTFYLLYSSDGSFHYQQWGTNGDVPVTGDFDGDSKSDFAIYRPSISAFYVLRSSDGGITGQQWGTSGDRPLAADFDGDGKTDIAVYRPSAGAWYYLQSSDNGFRGIAWGTSGDIPVAGEYDGDGKWDVAIFRPSTGTFYVLQSINGALRAEQFGTNGDVPVASAYVQ